MRVLIADDDHALRTAMRLVFEESGHEVFQASSVEEVRDMLFPVLPEALLIDAGLRGGGLALWEELQATTHYRGRALLITGDPLALGALKTRADVFAKPFDYDVLLDHVQRIAAPADESVRERLAEDRSGRRLPGTG